MGKEEEIITEEQKRIARYAKAMSHPIRVFILQLLSEQSYCYSHDLSDILPIAKSTLSQHLKELKEAGLIQGQIEPPKIRYCLNLEAWKEVQFLFKRFFFRKKFWKQGRFLMNHPRNIMFNDNYDDIDDDE